MTKKKTIEEEDSADLKAILDKTAQEKEPVMLHRGESMDPYLPDHLKSQNLRRIADIVDIGERLRNGQVGTGQDREKLNKALSKELDDYLSIIGVDNESNKQ